MPKIRINGKEVDAPPGVNLLKVCLDNGFFVPHYCWHPGLSPAGNCRMCLVKVSTSRKLEVSCMITPAEGLEVWTDVPEVKAARKAVLEYLLINHPLDCPICDKAGECLLQDYTHAYRDGHSRFGEEKTIRHTKDLGPGIRIWGNRCISCTRCVRFCEEVAGTGELCMVQRGDRSVVDVFPGLPIENPISLNVVDICPVGALNDKDFLYEARVWFTREVEGVCPSCSRGCNLKITVLDNEIKRLVARENRAVNRWWMCDEGRRNFRFVNAPGRLTSGRGSVEEIVDAARRGRLAAVVSAGQTIEEMYLFGRLVDALRAGPVGVLTRTEGERRTFPDGFAIEADKTPNRAYAERLFGRETVEKGIRDVAEALRSGSATGLLVLNALPNLEMPAELVEASRKAAFVAVGDIQANPLAESARVVIPGTSWAEKEGTFLNADGRIQRIRKAMEPPPAARHAIEWLQEALVRAGARREVLSAEGVFREAMPGLDYSKVGRGGVTIDGRGA